MAGIRRLETLISGMDPVLDPLRYMFVSLPDESWSELVCLEPLGLFREQEGITAIFSEQQALDLDLEAESYFRKITLRVHSSLDAVGLTAAVASELADNGLPANVIAAYYHDHVFVPADRADEALKILQGLAHAQRPA